MPRINFKIKCEADPSLTSLFVVGGNTFLGDWDARQSHLQLETDEQNYPFWRGSCQLKHLCRNPSGESKRRNSEDLTAEPARLKPVFFNLAIKTADDVTLEHRIDVRAIPGEVSVLSSARSLIYDGEFNHEEATLIVTSQVGREIVDLESAPPATPPATPPSTPLAARRPVSLDNNMGCFFAAEAGEVAPPDYGTEDGIEASPEHIHHVVLQHNFPDRGPLESGMAAYSCSTPTSSRPSTPSSRASSFFSRMRGSASFGLTSRDSSFSSGSAGSGTLDKAQRPRLASFGWRAQAGGA